MTTAANAVVPLQQRTTLVGKFAAKYSIEPEKLMGILKATAFKVKEGEVTNEQMAALLVVADQYGLNPFTREIFAFPDKGGIVPVVGVDGWSRIINDHPEFDGMDFKQDAASCTCIIYRKDRSHPVQVTEYLEECKRSTSPWQSHPRRMLRHKALIQCARVAFSFAGIYDEDEAERIIEHDITPAADKATIEMPQAKSKSATTTIDQATGEILPAAHPQTESAPAAAAASPSSSSLTGAQSGGAVAGPLKPSQVAIIKKKLANAVLSEIDLEAAFEGQSLEPKTGKEQLRFDQWDAIVKWIGENSKA